MDPKNLTFRDVVVSLTPICAAVAGVWFLSRDRYVLAGLFLVPVAIHLIASISKLPFEEIAKNEADREKRRHKTFLGRCLIVANRIATIAPWLLLLYVGVRYVLAS